MYLPKNPENEPMRIYLSKRFFVVLYLGREIIFGEWDYHRGTYVTDKLGYYSYYSVKL